MSEPRPKRPKIIRGDDDYLPGNITEIELNNFMTFNSVKCKPGPRLNLVIGPNGSGKSSLVCAIALGLAGEPQLLGRANSLGAFVKRGQESAYIKITLRGHTVHDRIAIMRKIDVHNKSEWFFNGKAVPKKDIVETIQKFNIQVNNLTQFLPQDKVCEFAKLTPVDLLEETEKAVGDPQLPVQHQALITKSNELKTLKRAFESNKKSLDELKVLNADIERDVERVRQREELLAKVANMKKKLPWLQYDMKKVECMEMQNQEKEAILRLKETEKLLTELEEPIKKQRLEKTVHDHKYQELSGKLDRMAEKRVLLVEQTRRLAIQVKGKYDEMADLRRQEDSRRQRISKVKEELLSAEAELANLPPYEPPKEKLEALFTQIFEADSKAKDTTAQMKEKQRLLSQHKETLRLSLNRLKEMDDANNKRLRVLARSGADKIFEAYRWVQEHRQEFRKEVYGPVLLEVNVPHREHADFLEGHVSYYIWKAFITQDSRDRDYLVSNLKPFEVPIINHVPDGHHREPFRVTEEMARLGISSRLDQVFDAPTAIKEILISQFGLEYSYIGSKLTDEKANEVQRLGIMDFWTPHNHYKWNKSRYGGHISASVEAVDSARLLSGGPDAGETEAAKAKVTELEDTISHLDRDLKELQGQVGYLMDEASKLHKQREEINNRSMFEKRKRREMERLIEQRKTKLQVMEKEQDIDAAIVDLVDQAEDLKKKQFDSAIRIKDLLLEAVFHRRNFAESFMASLEIEATIKEMEENLKHQEKSVEQAKKHCDWCKRELDERKRQLKTAKERAESIAKLTPILAKAFLEMPTTIEELEAAIEDTISEASSILCLNSSVLQEYENRQLKIDELMSNQEEEEREFSKLSDEINSLKDRWLPTLRNLVAQINETFSRNFKEMAVAGEVSLDECGMDFDRYGIVIKVKFRQAGQLQILSAHHQSGGERSVSTILYLVSLQDLTNCPFRVVDEINQGMDPLNERKMFQQLVRAASQPNTPQCFLLTPKLLPSLEYSEACSILSLMNGPWIEKPSQVWSSGENWGYVTSQMGESHC